MNTLPISLEKGFIFTTISINGQSAKVMVDWGDPAALRLSAAWARKQGLPLKATGNKIAWVDGRSFADHEGTVDKLTVGEWTKEKVEFFAADEETEIAAKEVGVDFVGSIGFGAFYGLHLYIDYSQNQILLSKDELPMLKSEHFFEWDKKSAEILVPLKIAGKTYRFALDTGCDRTLLEGKRFAKTNADAPLTLDVAGKKITLPATQKMRSKILQKDGIDGILGGDFLQQQALYIDFAAGRIYLCAQGQRI